MGQNAPEWFPLIENSSEGSDSEPKQSEGEDLADSCEEALLPVLVSHLREQHLQKGFHSRSTSEASIEAAHISRDISKEYELDIFGSEVLEGLRWLEWKHKFGVSEAALLDAMKLAGVSVSVHVLKDALSQSGLYFEEVHCCPNSHLAFTDEFSTLSICPHQGCAQKKYEDGKSRPRKCFRYIPLRCRVESWFKSKVFFQKMSCRDKETRRMRLFFSRGATLETLPLDDYIFGRNYIGLDAKKRFRSDDVCLALSVDGKNLFKSNDFNVWPVLLLNLNLSPEERCKIENMIPFGFIPGPRNPKDLQSFLIPLYEELHRLESGFPVTDWEGNRRDVRLFLLFVTADLPALSKVIRTRGHNALSPCRFCEVQGTYDDDRKTYYYPSAVEESKNQHRRSVFWRPERIFALRRTPSGLKKDFCKIKRCEGKGSREELSKLKGLHGEAKIFRFCSCLIPFASFPIDIMHLFYENIAPYMWNYLAGGSPEGTSAPFFLTSTEQVGIDLLESGKFIPSTFGRRPRNIVLHAKRFKAEEWRSFVLLYSSALLTGRLQEKYIAGWKHFVTVCKLCSLPHPTREEVRTIKRCALQFYLHFEKEYFRYKRENLSMMKLVFHLLLHIGQSLEDCGPLCNLDQFKVERYIGTLGKSIHSRAKVTENLELNIFHSEALKVIRRISHDDRATLPSQEETQYELISPLPSSFKEITAQWFTKYIAPYLKKKYAVTKIISGAQEISNLRTFAKVKVVEGELQVILRSWESFQPLEGDNDRLSCHVTAFFDENGERASWYGRVESFYSFSWKDNIEQVAMIRWCERLSMTKHGEVFASQRSPFGRRTVEDVLCLKTESLIGLIPRPDQRRLYIIDPRPPSSQKFLQGFMS